MQTGTSADAGPSNSSSSSSRRRRRVAISIQDGRAYVWSASDVLYLRSEHRLIGILTGSLPLLPQQNAYLGLPLQLMPEEVLLLVDRDAAVLVDNAQSHKAPTKAQWQAYMQSAEEETNRQRLEAWKANQEQKRVFEEALKTAKAGKGKRKKNKSVDVGEVDEESVQEKRKQRQARAQELAAGEEQGEETGEPSSAKSPSAAQVQPTSPPSTQTQTQTQPQPPPDLSSYPYTHITLDASDPLPWYDVQPQEADATPAHLLEQLHTAQSSRTKQRLFNTLNEQGYYLSCGLRFGGDFVVYPGDPFRYHSHYTLTCPDDAHSSFSVGKLIADGRLGTAVKKVHLIGTTAPSAEADDVKEDKSTQPPPPPTSFYSLTWAGFGT